MFINANKLSGHTKINTDICVIGAGAAGIILGLELNRTSVKVAILESGNFSPDDLNKSLSDFSTIHLPIDPTSRVRAFGGTTTVWAGRWKPHDEIDFEQRSWIPCSGWPIQKKDLNPYYERAAMLLDAPRLSAFEPTLQKKKYGKPYGFYEGGEFPFTIFQRIPEGKINFGEVYRNTFETSPNVTVYLNATVSRLENTAISSEIEYAEVRTLAGNQFQVKAKVFILAGGGIENARLLLLSDSKNPAGLGNNYDQVGRYFMDHPKGETGIVKLRRRARLQSLFGFGKYGITTVVGITLSREIQKTHRLLNSCIILTPFYTQVDDRIYASMLALARAVRGKEISRNFFRHLAYVLSRPRAFFNSLIISGKLPLAFLIKRLSVKTFLVCNFMEQLPVPENRVYLSRELDQLGCRKVKIDWSIGELEKKTMVTFHLLLDAELKRQGIGELVSPITHVSRDSAVWPIQQDSSHHMGTTRMGVNPRESVVDPNCKVHGLDNLYIAGSSIFPTGGYANPTATIAALTIRLADHIKTQNKITPVIVKKNVLIIGSGKRVQGVTLPAFWCLRDWFNVVGIYSRMEKRLSFFDGKYNTRTIISLEGINFKSLNLIVIAVTIENVHEVLKTLSQYNTGHITLMLDTPVLPPNHLGAARLFNRFKRVVVAEDSITLPQLVAAKKIIENGKIGKLRHIYLFHNGFRYHALAALKFITGKSYIRKNRTKDLGTGITSRELSFVGGIGATIIEPVDYSIGRLLIVGTKGIIADYHFSKGEVTEIGYLAENRIYRGLTINGKRQDPDQLDKIFFENIGENIPQKTFMDGLKIRGLMSLIYATLEDSPPAYSTTEGLYDNLSIKLAEKTGYFFDFSLGKSGSFFSLVIKIACRILPGVFR